MQITIQLYSVLRTVLAEGGAELGDLSRSLPVRKMLQKILQFNDFYILNFKTIMGREFVSREASVACRMTVILWEYRKSGFQLSSNTSYHVTPLQNILLLVTQSPVLFYISCLCR